MFALKFFSSFVFNLNFIASDPLEQFDLINFFSFFNNAVLFTLIVFSLVMVNFFFLSWKSGSSNVFYLNKFLYGFIKDLVLSKIEDRDVAIRYVPLFYYLFLFILLSNFVGMLPFSYAVTSLLVLPFFLSVTFFGGVFLITVRKYGLVFFAGFLPSGVPAPIAPFLIVIELVSYIMRGFSLAIRLFANILSGHILIKILISVSWLLVSSLVFVQFFFGAALLLLIVAVLVLEMIVCGLQAYVFVSLSLLYLNEGLKFSDH